MKIWWSNCVLNKNNEAFYKGQHHSVSKATNRPYLQLGMIRVPLNNNQSGCRHMPTSIANICACLCACFVSGPYLWKVYSYKLIQELELRNIADCAVYFKSTDLSITPVPRITWRLRRKRWRNTTRCVKYVLEKLNGMKHVYQGYSAWISLWSMYAI